MAKKKKGRTKGDTSKTSHSKKRMIILFIFILILVAAVFGYMKFTMINQVVQGFFVDPPSESESNDRPETIQIQSMEEEKPLAIDIVPKKDIKPQKQFQKKHYLKVATCLFSECQYKYRRLLKIMKLPFKTRVAYKKTKYYELVSEDEFSLRRAKEKIEILNKYNKEVTFPTIVKYRSNKYKISYGQFPNKKKSMIFKSNLARLYPKVIIGFKIIPKFDKYKITYIYAGPFSKKSVRKIKNQLKDNPDFPLVEISMQI